MRLFAIVLVASSFACVERGPSEHEAQTALCRATVEMAGGASRDGALAMEGVVLAPAGTRACALVEQGWTFTGRGGEKRCDVPVNGCR